MASSSESLKFVDEPGAFVAYLVTYSTTAHKFKQTLQSMLPEFAMSRCAS